MSPPQTFAQDLPSLGQDTGSLTVQISNEILGLLSSQLYQSPLKAIEELVVNSYDADAKECRLYVPTPSDDLQATLVYDDGIGMNAEGLADLWLVGRSHKRDPDYQKQTARQQIGKFGIGKLATYAIANSITYISRTDSTILAVSASHSQFRTDPRGTVPVELPVRQIQSWGTLQESRIFSTACASSGVDPQALLGSEATSWTIVLLEEMKQETIQMGRLRWVLRTAMPLQADFKLFLNKDEVQSSKEDYAVVTQFDLVDLPQQRLSSVERRTHDAWEVKDDALVSSSFPQGLRGTVLVTEQSLHAGKSADIIRSHGFFVRVFGRLINEDDPLFGLLPLSYQTFNRFRADIVADDLDQVLTAPREGIEESPQKEKLLPLLGELFYEARERYESHQQEDEERARRKKEEERTVVPTRLVEHPIADLLSQPSEDAKLGAEADDTWFYMEVGEEDIASLAREMYANPRPRKYRYAYTGRGKLDRLVKFDPKESVFYLNSDHDLVAAYGDEPRALFLLESVATAEAMLEVYLREHGMPVHVVGELLERRDALLRGLANENVFSVGALAQELRDSSSDEHGLEVNLIAASRALGFVATHLGGPGKPDGIARFRDYPGGEQTMTLEAKSSSGVPSLEQLDFAGLREHVNSSCASGCLLVAPKYPGEGRRDSAAAAHRAKEGRISCWTVEQLAQVVVAAEARHISAREILDVVLNHFAPEDVSAAVKELLEEPTWDRRFLYVAVIEALRQLEGRLSDEARSVAHVAAEVSRDPELGDVQQGQIKEAILDLAGTSQGALQLRDDRVIMNASLEEIERRVSGLTREGGVPRRGGSFSDQTSPH